MKKMKIVLKIVMGSSLAVYLLSALQLVLEVNAQPELYAAMPISWTTRILVLSFIMGVLFVGELILYLVISKKEKK